MSHSHTNPPHTGLFVPIRPSSSLSNLVEYFPHEPQPDDASSSTDRTWRNCFSQVQSFCRPPAWTRVAVNASMTRNVRIIMKRIQFPMVENADQEAILGPILQRKRRADAGHIEEAHVKRARLVLTLDDTLAQFAGMPLTPNQVSKMVMDAKAQVTENLDKESADESATNGASSQDRLVSDKRRLNDLYLRRHDTSSGSLHRGLLLQLLNHENEAVAKSQITSSEPASSDSSLFERGTEAAAEHTKNSSEALTFLRRNLVPRKAQCLDQESSIEPGLDSSSLLSKPDMDALVSRDDSGLELKHSHDNTSQLGTTTVTVPMSLPGMTTGSEPGLGGESSPGKSVQVESANRECPEPSTPCTSSKTVQDVSERHFETPVETAEPNMTPHGNNAEVAGQQTMLQDASGLDFGQRSSNFASPQFVKPGVGAGASPQTSRIGSANTTSRRRNEPLIRRVVGNHAVFKSSTPQAIEFGSNVFDDHAQLQASPLAKLENNHTSDFAPGKEIADPFRSAPSIRPVEDFAVSQLGQLRTPHVPRRLDMAANTAVTPAISWALLMGRDPLENTAQSTPQHCGSKVYDVDMHLGTDIFGTDMPAVDSLARIATHKCGGEAKVVVTRENGRLFVRFKLPIEYSNKFPESQCTEVDDSTAMEVDPMPVAGLNMGQTVEPDAVVGDPMKICNDSPGEQNWSPFSSGEQLGSMELSRLSVSQPDIPSAFAEQRRPLGTKDPNLSSPHKKASRALDMVGSDVSLEKQTSRGRHVPLMDALDDEMVDAPRPDTGDDVDMADKGEKSDVEMADAPCTRRSSRLRVLRSNARSRATRAPKSSISAPNKDVSNSGSGRNAKRTTRANNTAGVANRTRANTNINKGAEYPAQILAKQTYHESGMEGLEEQTSQTVADCKHSKGRPRKPRATQGKTAVEKAEMTTTAAQRKPARAMN
ncbi:hypothetical protein CDD81_1327 [Ophiocordyceps australis]|uniref:Uncharacterized protein n=1 Tax=Ophiocordyceps australis TaxID=1399860 RepID=A0A2C5X850_9HYPO|nr:hypothetical protein CDD81_1327 [Ophiocordyceps australis]